MKMKFKLVESLSKSKDIALEYYDLIVQIDLGTDYWDGPQWDEKEIEWTYWVSEEDCYGPLMDLFLGALSEEEYNAWMERDDSFEEYFQKHSDELIKEYYDDLLEYFRSDAEDDANEKWEPEGPDYDDIGD